MEENPALDEGEELNQDGSFSNEEEVDAHEKRDDFDFDHYLNDDTPYYKTQSNNYTKEDQDKHTPFTLGDSFTERLLSQIKLRIRDEKHKVIAEHLIGNLDESGYLRRELFNLVDDLAFSQNIITTEDEIEIVLKEVQELEPVGVGARDLKECLLIQLRKKEKPFP